MTTSRLRRPLAALTAAAALAALLSGCLPFPGSPAAPAAGPGAQATATGQVSTPSIDPGAQAGIPGPFTDLGNGLAFKYSKAKCHAGKRCGAIDLYAYVDCPSGAKVSINWLSKNDVILGTSVKKYPAMFAGQKARKVFETGKSTARRYGLTDAECIA